MDYLATTEDSRSTQLDLEISTCIFMLLLENIAKPCALSTGDHFFSIAQYS